MKRYLNICNRVLSGRLFIELVATVPSIQPGSLLIATPDVAVDVVAIGDSSGGGEAGVE